MQEKIITLSNGLRITYKYVPYTRNVHCGYVVDVGGRDDADCTGMAHFMEHIVFKGTKNRKTFHILNAIEAVGGDLNAYTTKEKTCVHVSINADFFEKAVDVLTDIVFHSIFPEKEIAKEKQVIMEEIDMYRDAPDEAIFEDYDLQIFPEHDLGKPILGTKETLQIIDKEKITTFHQRYYRTDKIVLSIVGNVTEKQVLKVAEKYLSSIVGAQSDIKRSLPTLAPIKEINAKISGHQAHEILGGRAMGIHSEHYTGFVLLQNILGGPAMNTRLNLNIREKHGLAYNISSFYSPFIDTGIWGIYYACEPNSVEKVRKKILKELADLKDKTMGTVQFKQAQQQLIGQLILGNENLPNQMLGMGKELLDYGKILQLDDFVTQIEKLQATDIQELAKFYFAEKELNRICYLPEED